MPNVTVTSDVDSLLKSADKAAIRTNAGLGATDTVSFGSFIPPSGTTAEIDAVSDATVGSIMVNTDTKDIIRFTSASAYEVVSPQNSTPTTINATAGAEASTSGTAFSSDTIEFDLSEVAVGESAVFEVDCFMAIRDINAAGSIPATTLKAVVDVTADIGNLGFGFPALPLTFGNDSVDLASGDFNNAASSTASQALGGFSGIRSTFPYPSAPAQALVALSSSSGLTYTMRSVKTFITITRSEITNFPVSYPLSLSFVVTGTAGYGFENSKLQVTKIS